MGITSFIDLTGSKIGRWTVISRCEDRPKYWLCKCECGTTRIVNGGNLRQGQTRSCGCWNIESITTRLTKHGRTGTKAFNIWLLMKDRCYNPRNKRYRDYGGRGIAISPLWITDFSRFLLDMGEPSPGDSIERIDVNGNYEPGNCKWIPRSEQAKNRRDTVRIKAFGREMIQNDWARLLGVTPSHIWYVLRKGYSIEWLAQRRGIEVPSASAIQ